jgi:1,4-dihydroxy-2-naphthoyl-CoA synthase
MDASTFPQSVEAVADARVKQIIPDSSFMEALEAAQAARAIVQSTEDAREGRQAFREKRKAVFNGR